MIRITLELTSGWDTITRKIFDKLQICDDFISYKVEVIKEDKENA